MMTNSQPCFIGYIDKLKIDGHLWHNRVRNITDMTIINLLDLYTNLFESRIRGLGIINLKRIPERQTKGLKCISTVKTVRLG